MTDREDTVQRLMGLIDAWAVAEDSVRGPKSEQVAIAARSTLESALREALMPAGWISVEDRLPEARTPVLAWDGERAATATHYGDMWGSVILNRRVTHWMPLTAAPAFPVELGQPEQPLGVSPQAGPRSLVAGLPTIADATCDGLSATPSASDANGR